MAAHRGANLVELSNPSGMRLRFMDWGATWLSCEVPLPDSSRREVLLSSPSLAEHQRQGAYLGATVGRYANRIRNGVLHLPAATGEALQLHTNEGAHTLHGGPRGFDRQRWEIRHETPSKVVFVLHSIHGDQGFPGNLQVEAAYELHSDNCVSASFEAVTDQATPVNITNHAYFNLTGEHTNVLGHGLQINASHYLPVDAEGIPRAELKPVQGTSFDFRRVKSVGQDFLVDADQRLMGGYDHGFLLEQASARLQHPAATLSAPDRRLQLELFTNKPAVQVYTGNHLVGVCGAHGGLYQAYAGIALESGFLADSPNHPEWPQPSCLLLPGRRYHYQTAYRFTTL